ncbi:biotin--[acetyl-CoA-carboxylase] ligase [Catellatospora sp. TT07R-123]|uniref:biotin--[acetyl-CoA-carboxylase] ligase n=1 Tax=Catellatospora sp. TT07R-123 TaxID=2733863 RepID=UPI001B0F752A|nr:biotin--[acetyl-CoA-carboxylase] ligase [Catellatospora sp. TT07R-123]GHJ50282.1 biotin--[acetyl-CoA-carboxylase] ligase [Catellatospora sp. TT07R-123]
MTADRSPLNGSHLHAEIQPFWRPEIVAETGSTNTDVSAAAREGAAEGLVLLAESQTAGRGRLNRSWQSPPNAGLALSVLLRPTVDVSRWGWLPLLAGVALAEAVRAVTWLEPQLKWPNDLLLNGRKCAGLLAEVPEAGAVVIGIGLNVTLGADELPVTPSGLPATSLLLEQAHSVDRTQLAGELLGRLYERYRQWQDAKGDPERGGVREAYVRLCGSVGREVSVSMPDGSSLTGTATTVDTDGRLVVAATDGTLRHIAAGDVVHLR